VNLWALGTELFGIIAI